MRLAAGTDRRCDDLPHIHPPDALVLIDDVPIGRVSDLREHVTVPSGEHRLEIRAEDFLSYYADLDLQGGESYGLIIELWPGRDELDEQSGEPRRRPSGRDVG